MKKKDIAKSIWSMMRSYWKSEERWWARGMLAVIIILNLAQVYLLVMLNQWNNDFYNALQNYDMDNFWPLVGHFSLIAFIYIIAAVYAIYLQQMLQIRWRTWMTNNYLSSWMKNQVYYKLQILKSDIDNPDQRISEDINSFITLTLSLSLGFLKQLTILAAFIVVLWSLSGSPSSLDFCWLLSVPKIHAEQLCLASKCFFLIPCTNSLAAASVST